MPNFDLSIHTMPSRVTIAFPEGIVLACPFFVPLEIVNDGSWPHAARLPLGAGWTGSCCASGQDLAAEEAHVRDFCNLGYASACPHLPRSRDWDAVRFSIARAGSEQITLTYACEYGHAPVNHGTLIYDVSRETWHETHPDPRVHRLATSFLHAYRVRQPSKLI